MLDKIIKKMRLPVCEEWDRMVDVTGGDDAVMHWQKIFSWCQDMDKDYPSGRTTRGYYSARLWGYDSISYRHANLGFRPAFELLSADSLGPDGTVVIAGTLYMNNSPVMNPTCPTWYGDITDYVPGARLALGPALDDPAYQVRAIRIGRALVADRVLLKNISWNDLHAQEIC